MVLRIASITKVELACQEHLFDQDKAISNKTVSIDVAGVAASIGAAFTQDQVDLECVEADIGASTKEILSALAGATHIGFALYDWSLLPLIEVAKKLRQQDPLLKLFAFGGSVELEKENLVKIFDSIILGEGELASVEILQKWLKGETAASIIERPISSLLSLPSPWLTRFVDFDRITKPWNTLQRVQWELTRGCPNHCTYCTWKHLDPAGGPLWRFSNDVRDIPIERIEAELDFFIKRGIEKVSPLVCVFNHNKEHALKLLDLFIKKSSSIEISDLEVRAELLDEEILFKLSKLAGITIRYGIESIHSEVLQNVNRKVVGREKLKEIQFLCGKYKISTGVDLIVGLPGDTLEGFYQTLDFTLSLNPLPVDIEAYLLRVPEGNLLSLNKEKWGMSVQTREPYWVISTNTMTSEDIIQADKVARACSCLFRADSGKTAQVIVSAIKELGIRPSLYFKILGDYLQDSNPERWRWYRLSGIEKKAFEVIKTLSSNQINTITGDTNGISRSIYGAK